MYMDGNCARGHTSNYCDCMKDTIALKSKEIIAEELKLTELFKREMRKSVHKEYNEVDKKTKLLLSSGISSVEALTSSTAYSNHSLRQTSGTPMVSGSNTGSKYSSKNSTRGSKISLDRLSEPSTSYRENTVFRRNSGIDDDKQQQVVQIMKITDLAHKLEERNNGSLNQENSDRSNYQKGYSEGYMEGYHLGFLDESTDISNVKFSPNSEVGKGGYTDDSEDNEDKLPKTTESERIRGGYQSPQQTNSRTIHQASGIIEDGDSCQEKIHIKCVTIQPDNAEPSQIMDEKTKNHPEFPSKHIEEHAFDKTYAHLKNKMVDTTFEKGYAHGLELSSKNKFPFLPENIINRGDQYIKNIEDVLLSMDEEYKQGFRHGFGDGFVAANIFLPKVTTFTDDEKFYTNEVRKCLQFRGSNINYDIKKMNMRAEQMMKELNVSSEEFKDLQAHIQKSLNRKIPLQFTKKDYKFYNDAKKRDKKLTKKEEKIAKKNKLNNLSGQLPEEIPKFENRAINYLTKHKINEFFQFLGSQLVANKPEDPISFLINLLENCLDYRYNEYVTPAPLLFSKKHVESIYYAMDPASIGYIELNQYIHGMEALGVKEVGDFTDFETGIKIEKHIFITNACNRLLCRFREMIAMKTTTAATTKTNLTSCNYEYNS